MCEMGNVSKELKDAIKAKQDWASSWWTQFLILFKRTFNERRVDYFSSLKILQVRSKDHHKNSSHHHESHSQ